MQQPRGCSHDSIGALSHTSSVQGRHSGRPFATVNNILQPRCINVQAHTSKHTSAVVGRREPHGGLANSYDNDADGEGERAASPSLPPPPTPLHDLPTLSNAVLARLQNDYPGVYAALHVYEKALRHHKEKYKAKEVELLRCIGVGEELLEQMDALKQRCEVLAHERDEAVASAGVSSSCNECESKESVKVVAEAALQAAASRAAEEARRSWEEEKQMLVEKYEAQCSLYREQLQDALQQAAHASTQLHDLETTLQETQGQLRHTKDQLHSLEDAYTERESAYAAQRNHELEQQQYLFQRQVAQVQQQADLDKETVLTEATIELERLQRALVRAEKELSEHQRVAERPATLPAEPTDTATVEIVNMRRQVRQLEDINHELQLQLRRKQNESRLPGRAEEGLLVVANSDTFHSSALSDKKNNTIFASSLALDEQQQLLFQRLQGDNARLRHKLQEVSRQAQDDVDAAHEARLELQQQLKSVEAQIQLLRSSVIAGLEQELLQARQRVDVAESHIRELQQVADEFEVRSIALQKQNAELTGQCDAERHSCEELQRELRDAHEKVDALQHELEAAALGVQDRESLVVQLQREKQQLIVALRTLQAQTATIEGALSKMHTKHEEETAVLEGSTSRLQERCVLLEHELDSVKEERLALSRRLRDAEEAVDVLKDAQRVAQETVRDAQRGAHDAEEKAVANAEQLRTQQQVWKSRVAEAEQERNRLRAQLQEANQRLREQQEELSRNKESGQRGADKAVALEAELRQVREALLGREEALRERWRQQYAQNTADREQLLANRARQVEVLQQQQLELQKTLSIRDERCEQLQQQRQQAQAALSEAVASSAAYKGRTQALEEELARVEKERSEAKAELRRTLEKCERAHTMRDAFASGRDTSAALRIAELETKLVECNDKLRSIERERQRAQMSLLQLVLPSSVNAAEACSVRNSNDAASSHGWDNLIEMLDEAMNTLAALRPVTSKQKTTPNNDRSNSTDFPTTSPSPPISDACQRAATAVLRSTRDWIERLRSDDEQLWAAVKQTVRTMYTACDEAGKAGEERPSNSHSNQATISAYAEGELHSAKELRDSLAAALTELKIALEDLQTEWVSMNAELTKVAQRVHDESDQKTQLEDLKITLAASETERVALENALNDIRQKYTDSVHKAASLEVSVDQLRHDVAERESQAAELEHRLESRTAEIQAERAEWLAKWQESQRHREKEKSDNENEVRTLREQLAAAEEAFMTSADASRKQSEEVQQQLRAQVQELQKTSAMTEAALRQQVNALTQEKARATQGMRTLKTVVTELEGRVNTAETSLKEKETQLTATEKALQEIKRAHHQALANGVAAEAYEHESMANQIASLQSQLRSCRQESEMMALTHAAEKAELQALRKVNASLESRLAEVEEDRAPLRQQLHSLLASSDKL